MKPFIIVVVTLFTLINSLGSQTLSATLVFEERVYNFGNILEKDGMVSHKFIFYNKGKTPVTIDGVHTGCGCIGKVLSETPVKPGGKGELTITFNPDYKSGFFSKEIVVFSNNGQNYNRIWVEGKITPAEHPIEDDYPYNFGDGLYLRLKVMAFGYIKQGETKQMELHYANSTNKEMVLGFVVAGNTNGLQFTNPGRIVPGAKGIVRFSYTMLQSMNDDIIFKLHPYVNNRMLNETLEIKILNEKNLGKKRTGSVNPVPSGKSEPDL